MWSSLCFEHGHERECERDDDGDKICLNTLNLSYLLPQYGRIYKVLAKDKTTKIVRYNTSDNTAE